MNKRKIWLLALILSLCLGIRAQNVLTISSAEGAPGAEVNVSIALQNSAPITSIQLAIPLNEELALVDGSAVVGSRCEGHSITVGVKDGILNVLVFSLSMQPIAAGNGEVASLHLKLGNLPKSITLEPQKMVLTDETGTAVSATAQCGTVTIRAAKAQYSTTEVDFGQVPIRSTYTRTMTVSNVGNDDLIITDLEFSDMNVYSTTTELPLIVSPGSTQTLNVTYAPVERGALVRTMKVVCNSTSKLNTIQLKAQPFAVNELHMQPAAGNSDEEVTLGMTMNNMDDISGYQVEFQLPSALEYVDGSFTLSNRKQDHTSIVSMTGGVLRIIVFSNNDKPLTGNDGEIGSFRVKLMGRNSVQLKPTKTVLSATINGHVENVASDVFGAQVTIRSPRIATDDRLDFGAVAVTEPCEKSFNIRNLGSAPLTVSRIVFNNENLTVKESLPLIIEAGHTGQVTVVYGSTEETNFEATMKIYSNDPDLRLRDVQIVGSRFAPNYFSVSTPDVFTDGILDIGVSLNTYDQIDAMQFDVEIPPQYELSDNSYTLEPRAQAMTVMARQIDNQTLRYFCYFLSGGSIAAGDGQVMTLRLQPVGGSVIEGIYTVQIKNIKLGTSDMADKYAGGNVQSTFRVKKHNPVTITANSYTRTYGEENPEFGFTYEGATVVGTPDISCEATVTSPVGEYPIVILKGGVTNEEETYVYGTLTIVKAPLTITAKDATIEYGEETVFEAIYDGFVNGEDASVLTKQPTFSCSATSSSAVGSYDINVSDAEAQNYSFDYVKGTLTIIAKDASGFTIGSIANQTYTGLAITPAVTVQDGATTLTDGTDYTVEYSDNTNVGTATVTVTGKGNYTGTHSAPFIINKATLRIIANDCSKNQWEENPKLTVSYEGFLQCDDTSSLNSLPEITTTATLFSPAGTYPITISGADADNYEISYVEGTLTVIGCRNISIENDDGVTFYYIFVNDNSEFSVTYQDGFKYTGDLMIPETATYYGISYPVTVIGSDAFKDCNALTSIIIPGSVTIIDNDAFKNCSSLTSITIPSGVAYIGYEAFSGCNSLTTMNVESGNTVYDSRDNCNAIIEMSTNTLVAGCENTVIPNNVTAIGSYAFSNCSGLTSISIPNSVTTIDVSAFSGCTGLTKVKVDKESPISILSDDFPNRTNAMLYVPKGSRSTYLSTDYWKEFAKIKEFPNNDVNQDDEVDVVDVVDIARFVVGTPRGAFEEFLADLNSDCTVNIADAVVLLNNILGSTQFAKPLFASRKTNKNVLMLTSNDDNYLSLQMEGNEKFTAFQFDLWIPKDMDVMDMQLNDSRRQGHQLLYNKLGDGHYRILAFSLSINEFSGVSGELLGITLDGLATDNICLDNIHFVTAGGIDVQFETVSVLHVSNGIATNIHRSDTPNDDNQYIYNLNGQRFNAPKKGLNIIGGKKVLVK